MNKVITLFTACIFALNITAQTFSDNFDTYQVGNYIGVENSEWTTWSGTTGGSEDAQVTDVQSSTSPNSVYFVSTSSNGGPQDVVLPFGGEYSLGQFRYETSFFVESNKGAYFNFQANQTIGSQWALDCFMVNDGNIYFVSSGGIMFSTTYPVDTWFDLKLDINLSTNQWDFYIDDELQGSWANAINQIASLDIYPTNPENMGGNNQCGFYIDNVAYDFREYILPSVNGAVILVDPMNGLTGQERPINVSIRNLGTEVITSFDLTVDYNGAQITESINEVSIASLGIYEYLFEDQVTLIDGSNDLTVTISNVNGTADEDPSDDAKTITISPITPAPGKIVLGEEGTGTWCQWCPRGAVYMDYMAEKYHGYWAGVAVHNGDPMTDATYDAGIGGLIGGYPSALVNRGADMDPAGMEAVFLAEIVKAPSGVVVHGAQFDESSNILDIQANVEWVSDLDADFNIACVLVEDHVTGTSSGYNQSNAYSGGGNGEMGGFEDLPNPVPADDMVYEHVGRKILPGFEGMVIDGSSNASNGDISKVYFSTIIDPSWDVDNMKIVTMLIKADGTIDNAGYSTLAEAIENGYEASEVSLTFNYDLSCIQPDGNEWFTPGVDTIFVNGSFNNWGESEDDAIVLTDTDEDMIYSSTIRVDTNQTIAYKYFVGSADWDSSNPYEVEVLYENVAVNDLDTSHCTSEVFLTFNYDLSCIPTEGSDWFTPGVDTVFVNGSFNNWGENAEAAVVLTETDEDMIYSASIIVDTNQTIAYKYFIGSMDWDNSNPLEVVVSYVNLSVNDVEIENCGTGVHDALFSTINIYPNPFTKSLNFAGLNNVNSIIVSNILGQVVKTISVNNETAITIEASELEKGLYVVTFIDYENRTYSRKINKH